jgi:hypothetical protein
MPRLATRSGVALALIVAYLVTALSLLVMYRLMGLDDPEHPWRLSAFLTQPSHAPQIPLGVVLLAGLAAILWRFGLVGASHQPARVTLLLVVGLLTVNTHVVTGLMLSQKNYYDYGLSPVLSSALVLLVLAIGSRRLKRTSLALLLGIVTLLTMQAQATWSKQARIQSRALEHDFAQIVADPLGALVRDVGAASKIALTAPGMIAPPITHQYQFFFVSSQCSGYFGLLDSAESYIAGLDDQTRQRFAEVARQIGEIRTETARNSRYPDADLDYCADLDFTRTRFSTFE